MLRVVFRRAAQCEFEVAAAWYAARGSALGEAFVREIQQLVADAAAAPGRCPVVLGDVRRPVSRRFPFAVYFRVREDALVVLPVFHGRRNPLVWHRRATEGPLNPRRRGR